MTDSSMGSCVPSHNMVKNLFHDCELPFSSKFTLATLCRAVLIKFFLKICDADDPMLRKFMGGS